MAYTFNCASELLDDRRFREEVLKAFSDISVDIDNIKDVEVLTLYDNNGVGTVTPFLRYTIRDVDGNVTIVDTTLDGLTPYVVTGTVETATQRIVEAEVLQLWDDNGTGDETPFLRIIKLFYDGSQTVTDTQLDATTGYTVTGTVRESIVRNVNPAYDVVDITPNDVADLAQPVDWIQSGGIGTIKYTTVGGTTANQDVDVGTVIWAEIKKVFATPDRNSTPASVTGYISK